MPRNVPPQLLRHGSRLSPIDSAQPTLCGRSPSPLSPSTKIGSLIGDAFRACSHQSKPTDRTRNIRGRVAPVGSLKDASSTTRRTSCVVTMPLDVKSHLAFLGIICPYFLQIPCENFTRPRIPCQAGRDWRSSSRWGSDHMPLDSVSATRTR